MFEFLAMGFITTIRWLFWHLPTILDFDSIPHVQGNQGPNYTPCQSQFYQKGGGLVKGLGPNPGSTKGSQVAFLGDAVHLHPPLSGDISSYKLKKRHG